jgi:hypothetical protein
MIPKKPAPRVMRGGNRFSGKIMPWTIKFTVVPFSYRGETAISRGATNAQERLRTTIREIAMSDSTTNEADKRAVLWPHLVSIPLLSYMLWRRSLAFTGSKLDWFLIAGFVIAIVLNIYELAKTLRTR